MLDDKTIKAILFARGGYGGVRIIDRLNFKKFDRDPKWIIGFSDATVFHSHINEKYRVASHSFKNVQQFSNRLEYGRACTKRNHRIDKQMPYR